MAAGIPNGYFTILEFSNLPIFQFPTFAASIFFS